MSNFVTILVVDDDNIEFEKKVAKEDIMHWKTVYDEEGIRDAQEITLPITVVKHPQLLDFVVQYAQFMRSSEYPKDREEGKLIDNSTEWEKKFFLNEISKSNLSDLIHLVNYLNFAPMLEAMASVLAYWMRDKTVDQARNALAPPKVIINTH